jgi:hypothetical protein
MVVGDEVVQPDEASGSGQNAGENESAESPPGLALLMSIGAHDVTVLPDHAD